MKKTAVEQDAGILNEYLSVPKLCIYAGLGKSTVWKLLGDPVDPIPSCVVGKRRLISKRKFDAWMDRRKVTNDAGHVRQLVDDVMKAVGR
jgi:hypothetical protein